MVQSNSQFTEVSFIYVLLLQHLSVHPHPHPLFPFSILVHVSKNCQTLTFYFFNCSVKYILYSCLMCWGCGWVGVTW